MELASIRQPVHEELSAVDQATATKLQSKLPLIQQITQYILTSNGKRIRPMILLLSAKAFNPHSTSQHIDLATSIELMHTATLLHDDVMDRSTARRGQKTVNTLWGNHTCILMGDFLYSHAFRTIIDLHHQTILTCFMQAIHYLIEGEMLQLVNCRNPDLDVETYFKIIQYKTAQLFEFSAQSGALLSTPLDIMHTALQDYGRYLGLAYQLIDDVLDYNPSAAQTGKNVGQDLADGKTTLPLIHALQHGNTSQRLLIRDAIHTQKKISLETILEIIESTGSIQYTIQMAKLYAEKAKLSLLALPISIYRTALEGLSDFVVNRTH